MKYHRFISAFVLGTVLLPASCQREADYDHLPLGFPGERIGFCIEEEAPETVETKSILTDASIETKRTGVVIGVYQNGTLVDKTYSNSFSGLTFMLEEQKTYKLYALVNMGDVSAALPANESGLSSFAYTIPDYTGTLAGVNGRGIPMAGALEYEPGVTPTTTIPVKRLLAKVTASLSCDWAGARIKRARVFNMNAVLKPFDVSAASGSADMLAFQELETASGSGTNSLSATFYVPENCQGTLSGITASENKAGDKNASVGAMAERLTYLQVEVESTGKYDGTVTYRSYLGANATTDFDIQRNRRYAWTLVYHSARVDDFDSDWKHDLGVTVTDYSLSLSPSAQTIQLGETCSLTPTLTRTVLYPSASSSSAGLPAGSASWSSSNPLVATVDAAGIVTGQAIGTATITAHYTPSGADFSERTASATVNVTFADSYSLLITRSDGGSLEGTTVVAGGHRQLKAFRVKNGDIATAEDITASAQWSLPSVSPATNSGKVSVSAGDVTVLGSATQGSVTVRAVHNELSASATLSISLWNDGWDDDPEINL